MHPTGGPLGILAGVTVRRLFAGAGGHGFGTEVRRGTVDDLHAADGVWLVSSIRLAAAVTALDGKPLPVDAGRRGPGPERPAAAEPARPLLPAGENLCDRPPGAT